MLSELNDGVPVTSNLAPPVFAELLQPRPRLEGLLAQGHAGTRPTPGSQETWADESKLKAKAATAARNEVVAKRTKVLLMKLSSGAGGWKTRSCAGRHGSAILLACPEDGSLFF